MRHAFERSGRLDHAGDLEEDEEYADRRGRMPGKRTLVERSYGPADARAGRSEGAERPPGRGARGVEPAEGADPGRGPRGGAPLDGGARSWFERAFTTDFSSVRVHEGPEAAAAGAIAYARGDDLFFAPGAYRPETAEGREILGHELTHVMQQRAGAPAMQAKGAAVNGDEGLEAEADRLGARAAAGERVSVTGVASAASGVQRVTHYPTKEGGHAAPWAIPTGPRTATVAARILTELGRRGAEALKQKKNSDGERDRDSDHTEGYMVGVVLLDDGNFYAACSGAAPEAFRVAVEAAGAIAVDAKVPKSEAAQLVAKGMPGTDRPDDKHGGVVSDKAPQGGTAWTEHGAAPGACAASKLIWGILESSIGKPVEMTERLFSPNDRPVVKIADAQDVEHEYHHNDVVPSCATCQAFLSQILPTLSQKVDEGKKRIAQEEEEERQRAEKRRKEEEERQRQIEAVKKSEKLMAEERQKNEETNAKEKKLAEDKAKQELVEQIVAGLTKLLEVEAGKKQNKANKRDIEAASLVLEDVRPWLDSALTNPKAADLKKLEDIKKKVMKDARESLGS